LGQTQIDIKDVLLSVTNCCLGSCVYCNLKTLETFRHSKETTIRDIERLLLDQLLTSLENIHITGGEPVLSPKTYEVFRLLKLIHPNIRVNMPVSGFFPYVTYRYIKKLLELMPQLRVDISVDGPKSIHEMTRGKGTWDPVFKTMKLLKDLDLKVQLQLTLMESNYHYIHYVQKLAEQFGFGFFITFPHLGTRFGHSIDKMHSHPQDFIEKVDEQLKKRWYELRSLNAQTWKAQKALWEGKTVSFDCHMGKRSIDVDPFGNVYPCMMYLKDLKFGNIKDSSLTDMLKHGEPVFNRIRNRDCQPCLMPCCPHKNNFIINGKPVGF